MTRILVTAALAFLIGAPFAALAGEPPYAGHALAARAHITVVQAQAIALRARPGVVSDRELEKEAGGSGLRYSFDIKADGKTYEVGVDANTGRVLENAIEGARRD